MMRQWKVVQQTLAAAHKPMMALAALLLVGAAALCPARAQTATTATRTTLTAAAGQDRAEPATVLTAHVTGFSGGTIETGSVSFETVAGSLGAVPVDKDGNASITLTSIPALTGIATETGAQATAVQAVYTPQPVGEAVDGGTAAAGSVSAPALVAPAASAVPDFTIVANPATVTTPQGQSGNTTITIAPQNGFSEQVTLSCSNVPAQVTCNFSPVIQTTAKGAFTSTLQLQTQASSGPVARTDSAPRSGSPVALGWLLPGVLALAGIAAARRRSFRNAGLLALAVAAGLGLGGCNQRYGYINRPPLTAPGTPKGSFPILISASGNDGSAVTVHTLTLTLVVQ